MISVLIIGHRGAPERALENTEPSIRAAIADGAVVIETDLRLTIDNHIVLSHDADFSRLGGPSTPIRMMTRSEIEGIRLTRGPGDDVAPLFMDHALRLFPEVEFNVDLKDRGTAIVAAWCELLKKSGAGLRCRTASFFDRTLRKYRRIDPGAPISVARFGVLGIFLSTLISLPRRPRAGEGVLQIPERAGSVRLVTPERIKRWHRWGWKIQVWTVDTEDDMRRLVSWGVDGIITNRPSLLKETLRRLSIETA